MDFLSQVLVVGAKFVGNPGGVFLVSTWLFCFGMLITAYQC
jgi:hypothetical protein